MLQLKRLRLASQRNSFATWVRQASSALELSLLMQAFGVVAFTAITSTYEASGGLEVGDVIFVVVYYNYAVCDAPTRVLDDRFNSSSFF